MAMAKVDFDRLLASLGETLGIELAFDKDGVCDLVVQDSCTYRFS